MDKEGYYSKINIFISVILILFLLMLFLFLVFSNFFYDNMYFRLAKSNSSNIEYYIKNNLLDDSLSSIKLSRLFDNIKFYPKLVYFKIYEEKIIFSYGNDVLLKNHNIPKLYPSYRRNFKRSDTKPVIEVFDRFSNSSDIKFYFVYDISEKDDTLFASKKLLFLIVFIFNFFIIIALVSVLLKKNNQILVKESEFKKILRIDELTGLLTKETFFKILKKDVDRAIKVHGDLTLVIIDIDNFFIINNKYGYNFGDMILKTISTLVGNSFRNFDFVGRFGSDEIIILMPDATENDGKRIAEKCFNKIKDTKFYYKTEELTVQASFGISSLVEYKESSDKNNAEFRQLLFNSLNSLSVAKRTGKHIVSFSEV